MARTDTLAHFLTDVADAIRGKTGSSAAIQASSFDTEIANIPSGSTTYQYDDVTLFDYDGSIIWSGKKADFLAFEEYPTIPTHEGLTAQGYNIPLADAKDFVTKYGVLNIGAQYKPSDDKEHIHITIPTDGLTIYFKIYNYYKNFYIDWGDGSAVEQKTPSSTTGYYGHTFTTKGDYVVKMWQHNSGDVVSLTGMSDPISWAVTYTDSPSGSFDSAADLVTAMEVTATYRLTDGFSGMRGLKSLCIAPRETVFTSMVNINHTPLKYLTVPSGFWSTIDGSSNDVFLEHISLSNSVCRIEGLNYNPLKELYVLKPDSNNGVYRVWNNNFVSSNTQYLKKVIIDGSYSFSGSNVSNSMNNFQNAYGVEYVAIPGINYIGNAFANSYYLEYLKLGKDYGGYLGMSPFSNAVVLKTIDFTDATSVIMAYPFELNNNARYRIVVPDSLYNDWIASPGWSSYTSLIVKASDYFGS